MSKYYNINHPARVHLTRRGVGYLRVLGLSPDKDNTYTSELWMIMSIFGNRMFNGSSLDFATNIELTGEFSDTGNLRLEDAP